MSGSVSRREQIQQKQVAVAAVAWSIFGLYIGPLYSRSLFSTLLLFLFKGPPIKTE